MELSLRDVVDRIAREIRPDVHDADRTEDHQGPPVSPEVHKQVYRCTYHYQHHGWFKQLLAVDFYQQIQLREQRQEITENIHYSLYLIQGLDVCW